MRARSVLVDLYGDHLRTHGWWAPVSGLVALTQASGVQPAATRTAVSRLVREGWLEPAARDGRRGYAATPLAQERLEGTYARVYAPGPRSWDGTWHVVVVDRGGQRRSREQVAASLGFLGYGRLAPATWVSPWASPELGATLAGHQVGWHALTGSLHAGDAGEAQDPVAVAAKVWDLSALASDYRAFLEELPSPTGEELSRLDPPRAYPVRAALVHRWRKFLFTDPGLPAELLPPDWEGHRARSRFLQIADALRPAADDFVAAATAPSDAA